MINKKTDHKKILICIALLLTIFASSLNVAQAHYRDTLLVSWKETKPTGASGAYTSDQVYREFDYVNGYTYVTNRSENLSPIWNISVAYIYQYTREYTFY